MGLVDYSESESSGSESEAQTKAPAKTTTQANPKRSFQKVVDRSNPGKIVVSLPQATGSNSTGTGDEPPAKRARSAGGGLFSGFNSFLPPPKNAGKPAAAQTKPGVGLRTGAAPGFSRDAAGDQDGHEGGGSSGGLSLPPPSKPAEPSIPEGQKPAEEVKLVGKPLMFKPLSVARNPAKKKKTTAANKALIPGASSAAKTPGLPHDVEASSAAATSTSTSAPAPPKKTSLFSLHSEESSEPAAASQGGAYEPLFAAEDVTSAYPDTAEQYTGYAQPAQASSSVANSGSLDSIADDLNLSAAQRRELFGRGGAGQAAQQVLSFNMEREYQHNEELRASGDQQTYNPVRAISSGKHSLQQLVQNARSQREALEESFAQGKSNRKEASSKYGW